MLSRLKSLVLSLPHNEASFSRRGFPGMGSPSREHLEAILHAFIDGYNLAVVQSDTRELVRRLNSSMAPEFVGFAYEGTGLYFALIDLLIPGSARLEEWTHSAGEPHDYIAMVGAGFAISRIPLALRRLESYQKRLDELTCFCLADGYGFHEGFFKWKSFVDGRKPAPASLNLQEPPPVRFRRCAGHVVGIRRRPGGHCRRHLALRRGNADPKCGRASAWPCLTPAQVRTIPIRPQNCWSCPDPIVTTSSAASPSPLTCAGRARIPRPGRSGLAPELLDMSVSETSDLVLNALQAFLDSWQGPEEDKWTGGYLAVRENIKQRLMEKLSVRSRSSAAS